MADAKVVALDVVSHLQVVRNAVEEIKVLVAAALGVPRKKKRKQ